MTTTFRSWMTGMVMAGGLIGAEQTTFADQATRETLAIVSAAASEE